MSGVYVQFVKEIKPFTIVNENYDEENCIRRKMEPEVEDRKCFDFDLSEDILKKVLEKKHVRVRVRVKEVGRVFTSV